MLKVNYNAAVKGIEVALACVVRNYSGSIVDGFGKRIASGSSVFLAEAIAMREACVFCLRASISEAIIESDNPSVVAWCMS